MARDRDLEKGQVTSSIVSVSDTKCLVTSVLVLDRLLCVQALDKLNLERAPLVEYPPFASSQHKTYLLLGDGPHLAWCCCVSRNGAFGLVENPANGARRGHPVADLRDGSVAIFLGALHNY